MTSTFPSSSKRTDLFQRVKAKLRTLSHKELRVIFKAGTSQRPCTWRSNWMRQQFLCPEIPGKGSMNGAICASRNFAKERRLCRLPNILSDRAKSWKFWASGVWWKFDLRGLWGLESQLTFSCLPKIMRGGSSVVDNPDVSCRMTILWDQALWPWHICLGRWYVYGRKSTWAVYPKVAGKTPYSSCLICLIIKHREDFGFSHHLSKIPWRGLLSQLAVGVFRTF